MGDSKVETISRLAQWKIDNFGPCSYKKSDPFKLGIWNWYLSIERNRYLYIHLFPEPSRLSKEQPPIARFIIRVSNTASSSSSSRKFYISPVHERVLRTCDDFVWPVDTTFLGRLIIDVEFLDLKIHPLNGGEASSIWPSDGKLQSVATPNTLRCLSRMLDEAIHADLTIITADGTLKAHKAVLSATSPAFLASYRDSSEEKESSTIHMEEMSQESCTALLSYMYGTIKPGDFWKHRLSLLGAANKYDIGDLKDACEESLLEDLNSGNVLERLNEAWLYQLQKLKKGCFTFLFDFGKIYDVREEINTFFRHADRDLMLEMFQEVLTIWK
ncbi:BTB/POZ domain-containing protein At1g21780-like [Trifolium pratense]|uniref:BTB/POZ domain-containing protein At1g21780-like n=1 Tax=Trifolium pratense TaxID=57577 RepID=UPI001E6980F1|nr:BTB/POZ domain-containing protein At1g21780-like [Trifolium pratense]